jgi:hypothetical protein
MRTQTEKNSLKSKTLSQESTEETFDRQLREIQTRVTQEDSLSKK